MSFWKLGQKMTRGKTKTSINPNAREYSSHLGWASANTGNVTVTLLCRKCTAVAKYHKNDTCVIHFFKSTLYTECILLCYFRVTNKPIQNCNVIPTHGIQAPIQKEACLLHCLLHAGGGFELSLLSCKHEIDLLNISNPHPLTRHSICLCHTNR